MGLTGQEKKQIGLRYVRNWIGRNGIATGTNTYSLVLTPHLERYYTGQIIEVNFTNSNTAASTINIDGLGAISIKKNGSTALSSGDIGAGQTLLLEYDGTNFQIIGGAGGSGGGSVLLGALNIFVSKSGSDATGTNSDLSKPYLTIAAAIAKAVLLTPSAASKINVNVYPGDYSLENITLPANVNLISVVPPPFYYDGISYASTILNWNTVKSRVCIGTITVTGDNLSIIGINCDQLIITAASNSNNFYSGCIVNTAITNTITDSSNWYDCHSTRFLSRVNIAGLIQYCTADVGSFAGSDNGNAANISGKLYNCIADTDGNFAGVKGALPAGWAAGNISGTLINCICTGKHGFAAANTDGAGGNISGTLINCTAIGKLSFGSGLTGGTISGELIDCSGKDYAFAASSDDQAGTISGRMVNCKATTITEGISFASSDAALGGFITGTLIDCRATKYGFCSSRLDLAGEIAGTMINCINTGVAGFASGFYGGKISGKLQFCINDSTYGFASGTDTGGEISGILENCTNTGVCGFAVGYDFATAGNGGIISGTLNFCRSLSNRCFGYGYSVLGRLTGTMNNCYVGDLSLGLSGTYNDGGLLYQCRVKTVSDFFPAMYANEGARFIYCDMAAHNQEAITSFDGGLHNIDARFCSFYGYGIDVNLTNVTATPYNTDDANSLF